MNIAVSINNINNGTTALTTTITTIQGGAFFPILFIKKERTLFSRASLFLACFWRFYLCCVSFLNYCLHLGRGGSPPTSSFENQKKRSLRPRVAPSRGRKVRYASLFLEAFSPWFLCYSTVLCGNRIQRTRRNKQKINRREEHEKRMIFASLRNSKTQNQWANAWLNSRDILGIFLYHRIAHFCFPSSILTGQGWETQNTGCI